MEVTIVSRETIKPSKASTLSKEPHKLCLFDQLTPLTYIVGVLFYPISDPNFDHRKTLHRMKRALSETLDMYHPFSGRNGEDNLHVADFGAGVPFLEARVDRRMSEYFRSNDVDRINLLVPFAPFRRESGDPGSVPLMAIQVSVFGCGGIAMGASMCHKIADATTSCILIHTWAALCRGSPEKAVVPEFSAAAALFPPAPTGGMPEKYTAVMDRLWFSEGRYVTRRFVLNAAAVQTLRERARSEAVPRPTRNDAVSCFIWKHATEAARAASAGRPRMSFAGPAVNVRSRMGSGSAFSVGNLFWWGMAVVNPSDDALELSELAVKMKEAMEGFDRDFLKEVKEGREGSSEIMSQLELMLTLETEDPYIIGFTNWKGVFNEVDFGWGNPYWVGAMGKVGPSFRNLVILVDSQCGRGIEAFIALEAKEMAVLEKDPEFLAFASLNPLVSGL